MLRSVGLGICGLSMLVASSLSSAESALRIACYDDNEGAKIYINNKFRGNCPIDVFIPGGDIAVKAVKSVDQDHARFFETSFYLPDDSAKSIEVLLSNPSLTQAGAERQRQAQLAKERDNALAVLKKARAGDLESMYLMSSYYREGYGVVKDAAKSDYWNNKYTDITQRNEAQKLLAEANNGKSAAMEAMAKRYQTGEGVEKSSQESQRWASALVTQLEKRASERDAKAMRKLSEIYSKGEVVTKDDGLAKEWASKAEEREAEIAANLKEQERQQDIQNRIDEIDFFDFTGDIVGSFFEEPELFYIATTMTPTMLIMDLIVAPTGSTDLYLLKQELAVRPAQWNNPNSMIAKAQAQRELKAEANQAVNQNQAKIEPLIASTQP